MKVFCILQAQVLGFRRVGRLFLQKHWAINSAPAGPGFLPERQTLTNPEPLPEASKQRSFVVVLYLGEYLDP